MRPFAGPVADLLGGAPALLLGKLAPDAVQKKGTTKDTNDTKEEKKEK